MVRVVVALADGVAAGLVHRRRHVRRRGRRRLGAPVRVERGGRAVRLRAVPGVGELRHGARRVVAVGHAGWGQADEAHGLLLLSRVVALRRGRGRLLVGRLAVGAVGVALALRRVAGSAGRRRRWLGHATCATGLLYYRLLGARGSLLLIVAHEEEDAETDEREADYSADDATDDGGDGGRRLLRRGIAAVASAAAATAASTAAAAAAGTSAAAAAAAGTSSARELVIGGGRFRKDDRPISRALERISAGSRGGWGYSKCSPRYPGDFSEVRRVKLLRR